MWILVFVVEWGIEMEWVIGVCVFVYVSNGEVCAIERKSTCLCAYIPILNDA